MTNSNNMFVKIINKIFKEKTNNTFFQLIRYSFVGGLAFLADFGTLTILTEYFKVYYLLSAGIAFITGLIINYILSVIWVFSERIYKNKYVEFILFLIIGVIGLGLNELIIWEFTEKIKVHYLISKLIATIIIYFWNFFARKYLLFNKNKREKLF